MHPELAEKETELFFGDVVYKDKELNDDGEMVLIAQDKDKETSHWSMSMKLYYEHCLACDLDPRMKVEGCMNIDEGWIARQLKKGEV